MSTPDWTRTYVRLWPLSSIAQRSHVVMDCADAVAAGALDIDTLRDIAVEVISAGSRAWRIAPSTDDIAESAAEAVWWLLVDRLYVPQSRVRAVCWRMVRDGVHRSNYRAVERAAALAAPELTPQIRLEVLAEIVASQKRRSANVARSRR